MIRFLLKGKNVGKLRSNGITLDISTSYLSVHLYKAEIPSFQLLTSRHEFGKHAGICFEAMNEVDGINRGLDQTILKNDKSL